MSQLAYDLVHAWEAQQPRVRGVCHPDYDCWLDLQLQFGEEWREDTYSTIDWRTVRPRKSRQDMQRWLLGNWSGTALALGRSIWWCNAGCPRVNYGGAAQCDIALWWENIATELS